MSDASPEAANVTEAPSGGDVPVEVEEVDCPLCQGGAFETVLEGARDRVWHRPGTFRLQRCSGCGLVLTRPRPTAKGLDFYYRGTYGGSDQAADGRETYSTGVGRLVLVLRLATLSKVHRPGADDRLLDVGTSYGSFPAFARAETGCRAAGLDIDADCVGQGIDAENVDYKVGRLEDEPWPAESFTVVTFFQSLEHMPDPLKALEAAHRLLQQGGLCLVEVPDFGGWWRPVFGTCWLPLLVPQHLTHFTRASLTRVVEAAGFEVLHWQSMLYPIELTVSLALCLSRLSGPLQGKRASPGRKVLEAALGVLLIAVCVLVDIPTQIFLRLIGRTGHQAIVARKLS